MLMDEVHFFKQLWTLIIVYTIIEAIGLIISVIFMDNLPASISSHQTEKSTQSVLHNLSATLRCLRHKELLLMVPLVFYGGISGTFNNAEWTEVRV